MTGTVTMSKEHAIALLTLAGPHALEVEQKFGWEPAGFLGELT